MGGSSDWRSSASQIQPQILQQHNQQTMPVYGAYPPMQMQMQQPPPPQPYQYQAAGGAYPGLQWNQPQQQQQQQPGFIGGYGIPQQQQQRGGSGRY
jgi:hypothetical protein